MSDWKRIAEDLREQVADLTKERDQLRGDRDSHQRGCITAQATNAKLREVLKEEASCEKRIGVFASTVEALALPRDTAALDARLKQAKVEVLREFACTLDLDGMYQVANKAHQLADEIEKGEQ
jgi:hypothetical protein